MRFLLPRASLFCALLGLSLGCGSTLPKYNASAPIEKRSVFLGTELQQGGKPIDEADLIDKLGREPASAESMSAAKTLGLVGQILGYAGGFLIGWPIGQAIAGDSDPTWVLAGIGGGLVVVGIPFSIASSNNFENAVDAHNESLKTRVRGPVQVGFQF